MYRVLGIFVFLTVAVMLWTPYQAFGHCQIPCGIYDDARQFDVIEEHAVTIEKAMVKIRELSGDTPPDYHMIARWTTNKEQHAQAIQDIVHAYFLTQRVKAADPSDKTAYENYVSHTTLLHQMLVAAMRCKQTTDPKNVAALRALAAQYKDLYFEAHGHKH